MHIRFELIRGMRHGARHRVTPAVTGSRQTFIMAKP